jgi:ABC-2 type transport system permease protein
MTTQSHAVPDSFDSPAVPPPTAWSATRPLYWSVRRELWENRSIYIAPLAAAGIGMLAFLISLLGVPLNKHDADALDSEHERLVMLAMPYSHVAWLLVVNAFIVGIFYCLDALYGERRDRSILFWKSMPVSDLTTVLAKASIPLVILPLLVLSIAVITQLVMLLLNTAVLLAGRGGGAMLWTHLPFFQMQVVLLYSVIVIALWHAPLYGWLLLISAWARRTTFLWAVLPLVAIAASERIAFHTSYFARLLHHRLFGFATRAFDLRPQGNVPIDPHLIPLSTVTPGRFLSTPGLWIGLAFAAIFLAIAVRLRRNREPI